MCLCSDILQLVGNFPFPINMSYVFLFWQNEKYAFTIKQIDSLAWEPVVQYIGQSCPNTIKLQT